MFTKHYLYVHLAADPGPKEVTVCGNFIWDPSCCGWEETIKVKYCDGAPPFYVYKLKTPPGCDMAYCAGSKEPCPLGQVYVPQTDSCEGNKAHLFTTRFAKTICNVVGFSQHIVFIKLFSFQNIYHSYHFKRNNSHLFCFFRNHFW